MTDRLTEQDLAAIAAAVRVATKESTQEALRAVQSEVAALGRTVDAHERMLNDSETGLVAIVGRIEDLLNLAKGGAKALGWVLAMLVGIGGTVALIREAFWPWPSH